VGYKTKEARKAYEATRKEEMRAYQKQYDFENRERKKAWRKKHYAENREVMIERAKTRRLRNLEKCKEQDREQSESVKGRHGSLRRALRRDGTDRLDSLWDINFYEALILDRECHYCLGPLDRTGGGLDRIDNNGGHTCYNVVPCCRKCNRIKGHDTSYQEMMLLVPALREIIRLKSSAPVRSKEPKESAML
jgi:hypothetical protein